MLVCIFNPEHDLCLANGGRHYLPPVSALRIAERSKHVMRAIYGDVPVYTVAEFARAVDADALSFRNIEVAAWGWNVALAEKLRSVGIAPSALPSDQQIDTWRRLQHRSTFVPLNADACYCTTYEEYSSLPLVAERRPHVLKAPWSGSGRGLRWIGERPAVHDDDWCRKVIRSQGGVVVEPRYDVVQDFAMEFYLCRAGGIDCEQQHGVVRHACGESADVVFLGYSLFSTEAGVYRGNLLLTDDEIVQRLSRYISPALLGEVQHKLVVWLSANVAPYYYGPLGVDMFVYRRAGGYGLNWCVEVNMRHTMGLAAHHHLLFNPADHGRLFTL